MPPIQWGCIRHIHLSALHKRGSITEEGGWFWPSESTERWEKIGVLLEAIPRLDSLRVDIRCWAPNRTHRVLTAMHDHQVYSALIPLKNLNAKAFTIELNVQPSLEVWERLGEVNFVLNVRERPVDDEVYGMDPRREHNSDKYIVYHYYRNNYMKKYGNTAGW